VVLRLFALVCGLSTLTSGCAYFTHYTQSIDLENKSYALDVKQRVIVSRSWETSGTRYVMTCAEPSPDALAVISASAGGGAANSIQTRSDKATGDSASGSTNQVLNVTAALAEQGAYIGLRTQSIQLLRDTMYRLCEGYLSQAISPEEYTTMMRRYQSTMMGLLAIEQLTRPVVAAQVALTSNATAQSGANANEAAVDKAISRVEAKQKEQALSQSEYDAAVRQESEAAEKLGRNLNDEKDARDKATKAATGDAAAKEQAANDAAKPYVEARSGLIAKQKEAADNVRLARTRLNAASRWVADAEADLLRIRASVSTSAGGSGQIGAIGEASAQMTADLSTAVRGIVEDINRSYMKDGCFALVSQLVDSKRADAKVASGAGLSLVSEAMRLCTEILGLAVAIEVKERDQRLQGNPPALK
jgi:hypothetical protein